MLQVRNSIFETNSSSTHSLSLRKKEIKELTKEEIKESLNCFLTKDNYIKVDLGEYNWGWDILENPAQKLKYILTKGVYSNGPLDYYMCTDEYFSIEEWIIKELGYEGLIIDDSNDYYVDHQSAYNELDEYTIDILTNPNYVIVIGNDNSYTPEFIKKIVDIE
jgi:hypothetical protein